ncbi:hypothetical protein B296_00049350 [Ensete ventricosum]|uniref:Uncharacterized protein n=1 Tax=Ensete ventricosum TaxID=4639 RepID=A0A426WZV4_ENSVE|nr:hypothetical protein B296_00049350 [Ensete ventricosum]
MIRPPTRGQRVVAKAPLQRGGRLRPGPTRKGQCPPMAIPQGLSLKGSQLQLSARKGWQPPMARPQGLLPAACRGPPTRGDRLRAWHPLEGSLRAKAPPVRATACKGGHSQERPLVGAALVGAALMEVPPAGAALAVGVATPW